MKNVGYIHSKITDAGINTVVSVGVVGLEFSPEATEEEKEKAQKIFDEYDHDKATSEIAVKSELAKSDSALVRGVDDIFDALIAKGILKEDDFSSNLVAKMKARKEMRAKL